MWAVRIQCMGGCGAWRAVLYVGSHEQRAAWVLCERLSREGPTPNTLAEVLFGLGVLSFPSAMLTLMAVCSCAGSQRTSCCTALRPTLFHPPARRSASIDTDSHALGGGQC